MTKNEFDDKIWECRGDCKRMLPLTEEFFYHTHSSNTGFMGKCKDCHNAIGRAKQALASDVRREMRNERNQNLADFDVSALADKLRRPRAFISSNDQEMAPYEPKE